MKLFSILIIFLSFGAIGLFAQEKAFQAFIPNGYNYIHASGPGLENNSGDIVLQLENTEEGFSLLVLLRKTNNKYRKIAENDMLLMTNEMLGTSGSGLVSMDEGFLTVDYLIGSSSSQSSVSIVFKK